MGKRLRAKPEALALRGIKPDAVHVDDPGVNERADHIGDAAAAVVLLEHAQRMASDAYTKIRGIAGTTHHAAVYAAQAVDATGKAAVSARGVLRALGRTL